MDTPSLNKYETAFNEILHNETSENIFKVVKTKTIVLLHTLKPILLQFDPL